MTDVYAELAGRVGVPGSLVRTIFQRLLTPSEAELLLALPKPIEELAAQFKMTPAEVEAKLREFVRKGVAVPSKKHGYVAVRDAVQFHDASIHTAVCKRFEPVPDDLLELWQRWRETEWLDKVRDPSYATATGIRILPLPGAVQGRTDLALEEDAVTIVRAAPRRGVVHCPCRSYRSSQGLCEKPTEVCLMLSENDVEYIVGMGTGRELTVDEALGVLANVEEAGLVSVIMREDLRFICNCCNDCCMWLRPSMAFGLKVANKSRFRARVEQDACTGCQDCMERCPFEAISMVPNPTSKRLKAQVDVEKCYGCGSCVVKCPPRAIKFEPA